MSVVLPVPPDKNHRGTLPTIGPNHELIIPAAFQVIHGGINQLREAIFLSGLGFGWFISSRNGEDKNYTHWHKDATLLFVVPLQDLVLRTPLQQILSSLPFMARHQISLRVHSLTGRFRWGGLNKLPKQKNKELLWAV